MNIDRFTSDQQESIRCEADHLFISAGAGTGKTATITAKVAYLLDCDNSLSFTDIGQLLAITFTRKAASELAGRIRSTLRAAGKNDQALLVDGAWVSTIHGMCSRILKDHAFELDINPTFTLASNIQAKEMCAQAVQTAIKGGDGLLDSGEYDVLFEAYNVQSTGPSNNGITVAGVLDDLVDALSTLPGGVGDIYCGPAPEQPASICHALLTAIDDMLLTLGTVQKPGKTTEANIDQAVYFKSVLENGLQSGPEDVEAALREVLTTKLVVARQSSAEGVADSASAYKEAFAHANDEYLLSLAVPCLEKFLALATQVQDLFDAMKEREGLLDDNDMLRYAYEAFADHLDIARAYARQFKLIMIDEFQDTDALQTSIAETLSAEGQGNELVTVGDAQQSIYRFRGADVNLFRKFAAGLPDGAVRKELKTNYRSHADILAFVNAVFRPENVFGKDYLELGVNENRKNPPFPGDVPRVDFVVTTKGYNSGVKPNDLIPYEAAAIASRFRAIVDDLDTDYDAGDLVLLLGKMTKADIYADALRAQNFEVVIAAGSVFWRQPEAALVGFLLRAIANPKDGEALYNVLASPLIALSAEDLVDVAINEEGARRGLWNGLQQGDWSGKPRIAFARDLMKQALQVAREEKPSDAVERLLAESGHLGRLAARGAAGSAECANLLKAVRKVRELEAEVLPSPENIARAYAALADSSPKDAPGVLMAKGQKAVRIMTIHASKGLQFPVVALSGFDEKPGSAGKFLLESVEGKMMAALAPDKQVADFTYGKVSDCAYDAPLTYDDLMDPSISRSEYHRRLAAYTMQEDAAEKRRLFYVGATRAEEALILAVHVAVKKDGTVSQSQIQSDLGALFGDGTLPLTSTQLEYGGSSKARYEVVELTADDAGAISVVGDEDYVLPTIPAALVVSELPCLSAAQRPNWSVGAGGGDVREFSYSSIAPKHDDEFAEDCAEDETAAHGTATQLGTAFHKAAERMVVGGNLRNGAVVPLEAAVVQRIAAHYALTDEQVARLAEAVARWTGSQVAAEAAEYPVKRAEVPFYQAFSGHSQAYLNGEIDLLCLDESGEHAFIVDYKTGGSDDETPEELQDKHRLQAMCYAEAVFEAGIKTVDLAFVRVERDAGDGQPQVVRYAFAGEGRQEVQAAVAAALDARRK